MQDSFSTNNGESTHSLVIEQDMEDVPLPSSTVESDTITNLGGAGERARTVEEGDANSIIATSGAVSSNNGTESLHPNIRQHFIDNGVSIPLASASTPTRSISCLTLVTEVLRVVESNDETMFAVTWSDEAAIVEELIQRDLVHFAD